MAGGWSHDGAVQEQIDASTEDRMARAWSIAKSVVSPFLRPGEKLLPVFAYVSTVRLSKISKIHAKAALIDAEVKTANFVK